MKKRIMTAVMVLFMMLLTGVGTTHTYAANDGVNMTEETELVLNNESTRTVQVAAGGKVHMSVNVRLKEGSCWDAKFKVASESNESISFKNFKVYNDDRKNSSYYDDYVYISDWEDDYVTLEFDIVADEFAAIGKYRYYITYECNEYLDEEDDDDYHVSNPGKLWMEVSVVNEKIPPQLSIISRTEFYVNAGGTAEMSFTLENQGELQAMDTYVSVDYLAYDKLLIPTYTPLSQKLGNVGTGAEKKVTVSYKVAEDAETQMLKLPVVVDYKKANGDEGQSISYIYLYVTGKPTPSPTATPTPTPSPAPEEAVLLLNTVKQSPASPKAGGKLKVTFYLENKGNVDVTNVKVSTPQISSTGFEPLNSEPYQYVGTIAKGEKKQVELNVKVGENISEGVNILNVQYTYEGGEFGAQSETVPLYILDVKSKEEEVTISRPKLMVSNFYTDPTEVKAGNVFDFTFDIFNTNDSIDAKNIKVTVSGASNAFSVTAGGNSFFVNKIAAQETSSITINLKASAAATTGAYPINIKIEYEYEGMIATETYSGEVVQEEILLQVKENLRPSVENVYVGSWDTPMVNQPTAMNFEFYNMGKSTLNNTYVTIEGDFMLGNGSNSFYIGNIAAGMPEYIEFDVVPLVEGDAVGKMVIHMEDSNGDEVTMEKEFTAYIMGETMWEDPGYMDPGFEDPGYMDPSVPVDGPVAEEPILPLWMFLCIQGGILVVVIPVTRAIRLSAYRRKIKKEDAV